jgi:hypothetical protein
MPGSSRIYAPTGRQSSGVGRAGRCARGRGRTGASSSAGCGRGAVGCRTPGCAGGRQRAWCDAGLEPGSGVAREGTPVPVDALEAFGGWREAKELCSSTYERRSG